MTTRCIAIDDEPIALSIIQEYCDRFGNIELETFTSPPAGMQRIAQWHPDVVFLDVEMNSHNGLDLARTLPGDICLIFTTAYSQYALDSFNVDAVDFLHKPVFYPRFERAMHKALKWSAAHNSAPASPLTIQLRVEHKTVIIDTSEITHIEAMDNYVKVFRRCSPMVLSQITMKEMEAMLPSSSFARVHRSYIVNLTAIERYSNRAIHLRHYPRPIPVGRKYALQFTSLCKEQ